MSYSVEEHAQGIQIIHVQKALNKADAAKLVRDVEQGLTNNKSKYVVELSTEAATAAHGYGYLEKAIRGLRTVAQKMHGDIVFVVPKRIADRIGGVLSEIPEAIQSLLNAPTEEDLRESQMKLKEQVVLQQAQINKLTEEVKLLTVKAKEMLSLVSQPSSDKDLRAALEHYRKLASEIQSAPPTFQDASRPKS